VFENNVKHVDQYLSVILWNSYYWKCYKHSPDCYLEKEYCHWESTHVLLWRVIAERETTSWEV